MIVDQMFIHNNLTIFQPLSDQYFDDNVQIKITEKQLDQEIKEDIDPKILSKINDNFDTGFVPFTSDDDSSSLSSYNSK